MRKYFLIIIFLVILSFVVRIWFLKENRFYFGYDPARDALIVNQIINGEVKLQGPPSSAPFLFHGVLYYYLLAPAYFLGQGDPRYPMAFIALINSLTIIPIYLLTYRITNKHGFAFLASIFYCFSSEAIQYANWLSNPTTAIFSITLMYYFLWEWIHKKNKWASIGVGIALGISIQAELFIFFHLLPITIILLQNKAKIYLNGLIGFIVSLLICLSTYMLAEIKFGFKGITGIYKLLTTQDAITASKKFSEIILLYIDQIGKMVSDNLFPFNLGYAGFAFIFIIFLSFRLINNKTKFNEIKIILFWVFSHIFAVSVGGVSTPYVLIGIGSGMIVLTTFWLSEYWKGNMKIFVVALSGLILVSNISVFLSYKRKNFNQFGIQKDMILSNQLQVIDFTYREAMGKPFSVNSLTSPLWINTTWTYMYKWYGQKKYGYLPNWHGRSQIGQIDGLSEKENGSSLYYLIIEPMDGIPPKYLSETIDEENLVSKKIGEISFGSLIVEKRTKI